MTDALSPAAFIETMQTPPASETFTTLDLNLAAFLVTLGFPLLSLTPSAGDSRRRVFAFPKDGGTHAPQFYAGATIAARPYARAIGDMKALLFRR